MDTRNAEPAQARCAARGATHLLMLAFWWGSVIVNSPLCQGLLPENILPIVCFSASNGKGVTLLHSRNFHFNSSLIFMTISPRLSRSLTSKLSATETK